MRNDTRFARSDRATLEAKLPPGTLSGPQAAGVWEFFLRADDPSHVAHTYRSYRDSDKCEIPRQNLRAMRDTMVNDMREQNKLSKRPRVETQIGRNAPHLSTETAHTSRRGA
jgi:hypothetical protein